MKSVEEKKVLMLLFEGLAFAVKSELCCPDLLSEATPKINPTCQRENPEAQSQYVS